MYLETYHSDFIHICDQKAVPKTKIRINLPGRSALLCEYNFFDVQFVICAQYTLPEEVHFFPENFRFWNSPLLSYDDLEFLVFRILNLCMNLVCKKTLLSFLPSYASS